MNFDSNDKQTALSDLPEKVLSSKLMGDIALEQISPIENNIDIAIDEKVSPVEVMNQQTKVDPLVIDEESAVNPEKFIGEKIFINREYSKKIGTIHLKFRLPDRAEFLGADKSYIRVFTGDLKMFAQGNISKPETSIILNQEILNDRLHIEVMLYYCTKNDDSICFIKNILFAVPLAAHRRQENITIDHEITGE